MSELGNFNSKILGSSEGYITPLLVAVSIGYLYFDYPKDYPLLFLKITSSTVCTPFTSPIKFLTSDIIIG